MLAKLLVHPAKAGELLDEHILPLPNAKGRFLVARSQARTGIHRRRAIRLIIPPIVLIAKEAPGPLVGTVKPQERFLVLKPMPQPPFVSSPLLVSHEPLVNKVVSLLLTMGSGSSRLTDVATSPNSFFLTKPMTCRLVEMQLAVLHALIRPRGRVCWITMGPVRSS